MGKTSQHSFVENPDAEFRAMGDDLVVVIEFRNRVVVLNSTARFISDQMRAGLEDPEIVKKLMHLYSSPDDEPTLLAVVQRTRKELIESEVLVTRRPYEKPSVHIRELSNALQDMDLSRSTVSQYE